ncbi:Terpene cyclase [Fulvia fulva]|uniref:Terpene cyclase n=1 Tax=Passalora fulva TaxID=5499 RepID=A0A9Q8PE41_PASFU|nr:Terpene cyclase [Fulvia fulva]KAK4617737.1 Terpene cyclase [Fulvia fulva]KAK4618470.1 Terpene cyclase [Fulvia fulva]UJO20722.1 Terpene cyclase [Fulvia fulva]WPV18392.1 Terpene cyclase [Fulvia fulva]WPV33367.1 Terpene cyclase [Fulvia fulva]
MPTHLLPITFLLSLSAFGLRSLHLFAISNGFLIHLEKCITNGTTPGGKPLRTLTTNGRWPKLDLQLRAVAVFLLIFCEDMQHADADVVGFSFAANWGASWILIVLEGLRAYSRPRFMSWTMIPGILIFNQSNAVFTPLYLAARLAVASPSISAPSLLVSPLDLDLIPWSFLLAYVIPLVAMAMPCLLIKGFNTKHVIASWYQQWNVYIALIHTLLAWTWIASGYDQNSSDATMEDFLGRLRPVYTFTMVFAGASLWIPVIISALAMFSGRRSQQRLDIKHIFVPPSPWSKVKCRSAFEGGKWLLQWDGIIGSSASAVWALSLFNESRAMLAPDLPLKTILEKIALYLVMGGPMAVATGFLWERDALVLSGNSGSLV